MENDFSLSDYYELNDYPIMPLNTECYLGCDVLSEDPGDDTECFGDDCEGCEDDDCSDYGENCGRCQVDCEYDYIDCDSECQYNICNGCMGTCEYSAQAFGTFSFSQQKLSAEQWNNFIDFIKKGYDYTNWNGQFSDNLYVNEGQKIQSSQYNSTFEKMIWLLDKQGIEYDSDLIGEVSSGNRIAKSDFLNLANFANYHYKGYYCESCDSEYPV